MADPTPSKARKKRFIKEYQKDLNGTLAAERAGYSPRSARSKASHILADPEVSKAIAEDLNQKLLELDITALRVLKEIAALAFVDIGAAFDEQGHLLPVNEIPEETRRALQGVDTYKDFTEGVEVGETVKIKLHDKRAALELLAKYFKLLTDKVEISGKLTLEALVAGSQDRPVDVGEG